MSEHIVSAYDKELEALGRKIAEMGGIAERMLSDAMDALTALDVDLARAVVASDPRLEAFVKKYKQGSQTPEPGSPWFTRAAPLPIRAGARRGL